MNATSPLARAAGLSCWSGPVEPRPLGGGITNTNFVIEDAGRRYVVRIGNDIPVHGIMRFNELAASRAAHEAGLSPEVVHHEPGALVLRFVEGRTLAASDLRQRPTLARALELVRRCHTEMAKRVRGPALMFWVFHAVRDYAATLAAAGHRLSHELPRYLEVADRLEAVVGRIELVYGHNDLLPANFLDDGKRLWLIDWDYGGFDSPLFDLANLCSNAEVSRPDEDWVLQTYFDRQPNAALRRRYRAMKCASLLREAMWSMVSEIHSSLDFDYIAYTAENLARFDRARAELAA